MKLLYEAPGLCLLTSLVISILLTAKGFPFWLASVVAGSVMLSLGFCSYDGTDEVLAILILCFLIGLSGSLWLTWRVTHEPKLPDRLTETAIVSFERPWGSKRALILKTAQGNYVAEVTPNLALREGDRIKVKASVLPLEKKTSGFNPYTYWRARGVSGRLVGLQLLKSNKGRTFSLYCWRSILRKWVLLNFPLRVRGYLLALLFGVKDPDLAQVHARWGTSHLLAVSGFHVALVVGIVFRALRRTRWKVQISLFLLFLYLAFTGFAASAMRAGIMVAFILMGKLIGRPMKAIQAVSLAAVCLLLWRPWFVWDVGWKLSVLSALAIGCIDIFPKRFSLLLSSAFLWTITAGIVLVTFKTLPIAGLITNIFAIPIFAILFMAVLLSVPIALLPYGLGATVISFVEKSILAFEYVLNWMTSFVSMSIVDTWHWPFISLAVFFIILARKLELGCLRSVCVTICGLMLYGVLLS